MALRDLIEHDYRHMDGVEDVAVLITATATTITGVKALPRSLDKKSLTAFAGVEIKADDCVFHVWSVTLTNHAQRLNTSGNDEITDADGVAWVIISCTWETLKTRWRCLCRKKVV